MGAKTVPCAMNILRTWNIISNAVFVIVALALLAVGINSQTHLYKAKEYLQLPENISVAIIVLGTLILLVSILGCCGSIRLSRCMLWTFFAILLILLVGQVGVAVYATKHTKEVEKVLRKGWNEDSQKDREYIQDKFKCCGFDSITEGTNCNITPDTVPCFPKLKAAFDHDLRTISIVAYCVAAVEAFSLVSTLLLLCSIRDARGYKQLENEYLLQSSYLPPGQTTYSSPSELYPNLRADVKNLRK